MRDVSPMRTTLNLDDDVLRAVKEIARLRDSTAGEVLSELARAALATEHPENTVRNGVPILASTADEAIVTSDIVDRLQDDG
jgi:hypothetical protein